MNDTKFKIIDSHCHIFPDEIAKKATESTDKFYDITESGIIDGSAFIGTAENLINQCDEAGV